MSIIIQVGHRSSNSNVLIEKLYERGLNRPLPSYTHNLAYKEVISTIDKIFSKGNKTIADSKLADNIMVDFLLANIDQENWGWEAEKNLEVLEYWLQLEPDVRFILVFDHPKNILADLVSDEVTVDVIDRLMNEWIAYHNKLLGLFNEYQNNAILIEGEAAIQNLGTLNEQVQSIAHTLTLKSNLQTKNLSDNSVVVNESLVQKKSITYDLLVGEILRKYPNTIKIFNELLNKADMKYNDDFDKSTGSELDDLVDSLVDFQENGIEKKLLIESQDLNKELNKNKVEINNKNIELKKLQSKIQMSNQINTENRLLVTQLHQVQEELERYYTETNKLKSESDEANKIKKLLNEERKKKEEVNKKLNALKNQKDNEKKELEKKLHSFNNESHSNEILIDIEDKLLINQLHQVQEELEVYYVETNKLKSKISKMQTIEKLLNKERNKNVQVDKKIRESKNLIAEERKGKEEIKKKLNDLKNEKDNEIKELKQKLNSSNEKLNSRILADSENRLLISQLHQVQEELEKFYISKELFKSNQISNKPLHYGAVDRVKKDLPYRLGSTMVKNANSAGGLAKLPFALAKEYREYQKDDVKKLPEIEEYQDAYEAERIKKHLSYKLGKTLVNGFKSPKDIVSIPKKMINDYLKFKSN